MRLLLAILLAAAFQSPRSLEAQWLPPPATAMTMPHAEEPPPRLMLLAVAATETTWWLEVGAISAAGLALTGGYMALAWCRDTDSGGTGRHCTRNTITGALFGATLGFTIGSLVGGQFRKQP